MMQRILILLLLPLALMAAKVEYLRWDNGMTYLSFLAKQDLPSRALYWNLDSEDRKLTEEIYSGVGYQILRDDNGSTVQQVLIPISDELQLHIYQDAKGEYAFEAIPIIYTTKHLSFTTTIENNPSLAIYKATHSRRAMSAFISGFRKSINFALHVQKDDPIVMIYDQKFRFGKPFSMPRLQLAKVRLHGEWHGVYLGSDERYYDAKGHEVEGFLLENPIKGARISSGFTLRRWHPVLHKYRAHLGIDYAARTGTPIHAAGAGVIIDAHRSPSYGNVMKIRHADGYMTLYAHQQKFRAGMYTGKRVKKDEIVGYVGTTGLSSGPHLHFGLYKNNRPINPRNVIQVTTSQLSGKKKLQFDNIVKHYDEEAERILATNKKIDKIFDFDNVCYVKHDPFEEAAESNETL
ncbi:peptidoglycan DD-metalloendopeptidase family protein [bacterium]|nr:peptidoglycan DD-metalloendopeptidase family protein [bacterium]